MVTVTINLSKARLSAHATDAHRCDDKRYLGTKRVPKALRRVFRRSYSNLCVSLEFIARSCSNELSDRMWRWSNA
jgi:hypothetical protein